MTFRFLTTESVKSAYGIEEDKLASGEASFDTYFSKVSLESILFYVVAFAIWSLEKIFDLHKAEMEELLHTKHSHTLRWYVVKAKEFMYGSVTHPDGSVSNQYEENLGLYHDEYDLTGLSDFEIEKARIIHYAACERSELPNKQVQLTLKVAKDGGEELEALSDSELDAFSAYILQIRDAGVKIKCMSEPADQMIQVWTIYYDPQVLDGKGRRLDDPAGGSVVKTAIRNYLKNLPFNGVYVRTYHVDAIQQVEGVKIPVLEKCDMKRGNGTNQQEVDQGGVTPYAGWFRFYDELNDDNGVCLKIAYEPYVDVDDTKLRSASSGN
ncbi:MAG: hypothetical protein LUG18_15240 [Candidatus Azobacteroides sp.]|nr:hypothetical protein [Candidatus Azobacteroides sp.]